MPFIYLFTIYCICNQYSVSRYIYTNHSKIFHITYFQIGLKCGVNISCKVSTMSWGRTAKRSKEASCAAVTFLELFSIIVTQFRFECTPSDAASHSTNCGRRIMCCTLPPTPIWSIAKFSWEFMRNSFAVTEWLMYDSVWLNVVHIEWQPFPKYSSQYCAKIYVLNVSTQMYTTLHTTDFILDSCTLHLV